MGGRTVLHAAILKKAKTLNDVWNEEHPARRKAIAVCIFAVTAALALWQCRDVLHYSKKALRSLRR